MDTNENITKNDDGTVTLTLSSPVKSEGKEIGQLVFRRLKGRDLEASDGAKGSVGREIMMVAASTNVPPSTIRDLDGYDYTVARGVIEDFLSNPRKSAAPALASAPSASPSDTQPAAQ